MHLLPVLLANVLNGSHGFGDTLQFHAVEEEGGDVVVFEGEDGPVGAGTGC